MRTQLKPRRLNSTLSVDVSMDGAQHKVLMTVGFDETGHIRELFCASFRAGTGLNVLVMDACILVSLLLQHGYSISEIDARMAEGPSLIGTLVRAAARLEAGEI